MTKIDTSATLGTTEIILPGSEINAAGADHVSLTGRILSGDQSEIHVYASNRADFCDETQIDMRAMNLTNVPHFAATIDAGFLYYRLKGIVDVPAGGTTAVIAATLVAY